jgi:hypothetical protein
MYEVAEKALDIEAAARGARGRFLGCRWLSLRMRQLVHEHYDGTKYAADKVRAWWLDVYAISISSRDSSRHETTKRVSYAREKASDT